LLDSLSRIFLCLNTPFRLLDTGMLLNLLLLRHLRVSSADAQRHRCRDYVFMLHRLPVSIFYSLIQPPLPTANDSPDFHQSISHKVIVRLVTKKSDDFLRPIKIC
jgi:hypothetical protein